MDSSNPDVSVCLCAYHTPEHPRAHWLRGCVDSILAQEDISLELIVLDNGSGPEVAEILDSVKDPRMKRLRFESNWMDHAWGVMAEMASGRYTCMFCDDDEMLPGCLSGQVHALDLEVGDLAAPTEIDEDDLGFETLFIRCFIPLSGTIFRSKFNPLVRKEMVGIEGDWAMWLAIAADGKIIRVPTGRVNQRIHRQSDSVENGFGAAKFVEDHLRIWKSWIVDRGYVPDEIQLWSMIENFKWFLQRSNCSDGRKWGYMKQLRQLLFGIV